MNVLQYTATLNISITQMQVSIIAENVQQSKKDPKRKNSLMTK